MLATAVYVLGLGVVALHVSSWMQCQEAMMYVVYVVYVDDDTLHPFVAENYFHPCVCVFDCGETFVTLASWMVCR